MLSKKFTVSSGQQRVVKSLGFAHHKCKNIWRFDVAIIQWWRCYRVRSILNSRNWGWRPCSVFAPFQKECDMCEESFTLPRYLKKHVLIAHSGNQYHKCDQCDGVFSKPYKLKYHIRQVHDQIKDYKCDTCGKEFTTSSNLNKHVRVVHQGVKKYTSDIWNSRSFEKSSFENMYLPTYIWLCCNKSTYFLITDT